MWELRDSQGTLQIVFYERNGFLELYTLIVPKEHRRKGVGSAVIAELEREASRRGLLGVRVRSVVSEDLVNMLLRRGYVPVSLVLFEKALGKLAGEERDDGLGPQRENSEDASLS